MDAVFSISPQQFAQLSGLSIATIRRRIRDGSLPAIQIGGFRTRWLVPIAAVQRLNSAGTGDAIGSVTPPSDSRMPAEYPDSAVADADRALDADPKPAHQPPGSATRPSGPRPKWMATDPTQNP